MLSNLSLEIKSDLKDLKHRTLSDLDDLDQLKEGLVKDRRGIQSHSSSGFLICLRLRFQTPQVASVKI